jgi:hypothetical protein
MLRALPIIAITVGMCNNLKVIKCCCCSIPQVC